MNFRDWMEKLQLDRFDRLMPATAGILVLALIALFTTSPSNSRQIKTGPGESASSPLSGEVLPGTEVPGQTVPSPGGSPGAAKGSGKGSGTAGSRALGTGPVPGLTIAGTAHGIDLSKGTITIGLQWLDTEKAQVALSAIGAGDLALGDPKRFQEILIEDTNARGGVLGLKVIGDFVEANVSSSDPAADEQAACDHWTRDTPGGVFAIFAGSAYGLADCAEKRGVVRQSAGLSLNDSSQYERWPHFFEPALNLTRVGAATVDGLHGQSYFDPYFPTGTKIGVMTYDNPSWETAVNQGLIPALQRHGLQVTDVQRIIFPPTLNNTATLASQMNNAVLKWDGLNIDHVLFLEAGGRLILEFSQRAERAEYRPRYGLNTANQAQTLSKLDAFPPEQLKNSLGVGWFPASDQDLADYPDSAGTSTRQRCLQLMKDNGYRFSGADDRALAALYCEMFWLFKASFERGGKAISIDKFVDGITAVGDSYEPTTVFSTRFSRTRHDGVYSGRNFGWNDGLQRFQYTSPIFNIP